MDGGGWNEKGVSMSVQGNDLYQKPYEMDKTVATGQAISKDCTYIVLHTPTNHR